MLLQLLLLFPPMLLLVLLWRAQHITCKLMQPMQTMHACMLQTMLRSTTGCRPC